MPAKERAKESTKRRLKRLLAFDLNLQQLYRNSQQLSISESAAAVTLETVSLIGLDEVGRGCLAGPVVAAAVYLPRLRLGTQHARALEKLNDSKMLSDAERRELAATLHDLADCAFGQASVEEIDTLNILQASLLAMKRARLNLTIVSPAVLLIDGNKTVPGLPDRQLTIIKGDSQSASIAAASIVAKVHRDQFMCELSERFPEYAWHQNKGYGSEHHRRAIKQHGLTTWHRKSFKVDLSD
jgi:ribonuclease HII